MTLGVAPKQTNHWTEREIELLKVIWGCGWSREQIEALFPRHTYGSIRSKAKKLGLKRKVDTFWTPEEDQLIVELYPSAPKEAILKAIPRHTWSAIQARANQLGIRRLTKTLWKCPTSRLANGEVTDFELGFIVGLLEGEGSISIHNDKRRDKNRVSISIGNTNLELLKKAQGIIGGQIVANKKTVKGNTMYHLQIQSHGEVYAILKRLLPFLIVKRRKAIEAIKYLEELGQEPCWVRK